jgi:hypothetical protein
MPLYSPHCQKMVKSVPTKKDTYVLNPLGKTYFPIIDDLRVVLVLYASPWSL